MSGHSKWHNIQAKKGKADAARGKVFTKLGRELLIAVKQGGPDPAGNSKLKDVIAKCKAANMPNDTINNAIKKASGEGNDANYEEVVYEGYGPNGVAVIVNANTDNRNRTAADVRHVFDKAGGNLGTTGCVSYMFDKKGVIVIEKASTDMDEEELMLLALDAGADDFNTSEEVYEITTAPSNFSEVREKLEDAGLTFLEAEVQMVPTTTVSLDEKGVEKMERLIERLEELDTLIGKYKEDTITFNLGIHGLYTTTSSFIDECLEFNKKHNLNIHMHFCENEKEVSDIKNTYNLNPVDILEGKFNNQKLILAHCVKLTKEDIIRLSKLNVSVVHCPVSNLKLGCGIANINEMLNNNINVCLGTDGQGSGSNLDLFEVMKFTALLQKGINEAEEY